MNKIVLILGILAVVGLIVVSGCKDDKSPATPTPEDVETPTPEDMATATPEATVDTTPDESTTPGRSDDDQDLDLSEADLDQLEADLEGLEFDDLGGLEE